jgi:hypothetical protein
MVFLVEGWRGSWKGFGVGVEVGMEGVGDEVSSIELFGEGEELALEIFL